MIKKNKLSLKKIISKSWQIYLKNFLSWLDICILVYIPMYVCISLIPKNLPSPLELFKPNNNSLVLDLISSIIYFIPMLLFNPLAVAAIAWITWQSLIDKEITYKDILDHTLMRWKDLIFATFLYYLIIFISSIFIIPAIYFSVAFYFYICIVALTTTKGYKALSISRLALIGSWFKAFGMIFFASFISFIINYFIVRLMPINLQNDIISRIFINIVCELLDIFFKIILFTWFLNLSTIEVTKSDDIIGDQK